MKSRSRRRETSFEQAFLLLSAKYRARGYEVPSDKPFRFTPFHVLPRTLTFVAKHGKQVVATLSLVPDNELLGLPMEGLYGSEIAGLRRAGGRIAEATSLADRISSTTEFLQVFLSLIKLLMQSHVRRGGDCWVITVNPRHAAFYRRMLGFRRLGPRRSYDVVEGHPAEAYVLDVDSMQQAAPKMHEDMLCDPLPDDVLMARAPPCESRPLLLCPIHPGRPIDDPDDP